MKLHINGEERTLVDLAPPAEFTLTALIEPSASSPTA